MTVWVLGATKAEAQEYADSLSAALSGAQVTSFRASNMVGQRIDAFVTTPAFDRVLMDPDSAWQGYARRTLAIARHGLIKTLAGRT